MDKPNDVLRMLRRLCRGRPNDVAYMALNIESLDAEKLRDLDLSLLSELKRGKDGQVEIKLINRLDALELLYKIESESETPLAENFFSAIESAAAELDT